MKRRLTKEEFIARSELIHNFYKNRGYGYGKVEYTSTLDFVTIVCPTHGEFQQQASNHLQGYGCQKCSTHKKVTSEMALARLKKKFGNGNRYDYSKVAYKNTKTPITVICKKHGPFDRTLGNHLRTTGCPKCAYERLGFNNLKK